MSREAIARAIEVARRGRELVEQTKRVFGWRGRCYSATCKAPDGRLVQLALVWLSSGTTDPLSVTCMTCFAGRGEACRWTGPVYSIPGAPGDVPPSWALRPMLVPPVVEESVDRRFHSRRTASGVELVPPGTKGYDLEAMIAALRVAPGREEGQADEGVLVVVQDACEEAAGCAGTSSGDVGGCALEPWKEGPPAAR